MTNQDSPAAPTPPQRPRQLPSVPPPGQAVVGPPVLLDQGESDSVMAPIETVSKSNKGMRAGLAAALLAVAGLGGFAVKAALSEPAGAQSPEEAMDAFFEALDNEDIIGMAETLLPSEREAFIDPVLVLTDEAERLEIFGEGVEIDTFGTVDVVVEGLVTSSTPLAPGFATVSTTEGTIEIIGTSDDIPVAAVIGDWMNVDPEVIQNEKDDLANDPLKMVAVRQDGIWYLSVTYTAAEAVRSETNKPLPVFGEGPTPVGGATPEEAVAQLLEESVALDLEGILTQLDPEEMAALYDYSPLFLSEGQRVVDDFLDQVRSSGASWKLSDLVLRTDTSKGRTAVVVDGFSFVGSSADLAFELTLAEGCTTFVVESDFLAPVNETTCGDELKAGGETIGDLLDDPYSNLALSDLGITVVERDGRWFVSTVPTFVYNYVDLLATLEPSDIDALKQEYGELFSALSSFDDTGFAGSGFGQGEFIAIEDAVPDD